MIGPARLAGLAERYGTPLYVYDLAELRAAHAALRRALPEGARLYYSLKANPHPELVRGLAAAGCSAEVCSESELDAARTAGVAAADVLCTGPGKTAAELRHALTHGVRRFSVESPVDLARLGAAARAAGVRAEALLRLNPETYPAGAGLAMGGAPTQFGSDVSWVRRSPGAFRTEGVDLIGYHVYSGSNVHEPAQLAHWFTAAADAVTEAQRALRLDLRALDLGGGFGHPYLVPGGRPDLGALRPLLTRLLKDRIAPLAERPVELAFESGRYLAGAAGRFVVRVQDVKTSKGRRVVVADGGINALGGMAGLRRIPPMAATAVTLTAGGGGKTGRDGATGGADDTVGADDTEGADDTGVPERTGGAEDFRRAEPTGDALLTGPLCTTLDVLNARLPLPDVRPGDLLAIPNCGAYGMTASLLAFLGRRPPAEVFVDAGRVRAATVLRLSRHDIHPRRHP
ncbi:type III PLP-dependent enzyme [Streptomyces sp. NPDC059631]|uniref:type III PLP-dependent enzyme n=1 Tax=unclassified Streptomyces TaxID=2593676 RepID=UPI00369E0634